MNIFGKLCLRKKQLIIVRIDRIKNGKGTGIDITALAICGADLWMQIPSVGWKSALHVIHFDPEHVRQYDKLEQFADIQYIPSIVVKSGHVCTQLNPYI